MENLKEFNFSLNEKENRIKIEIKIIKFVLSVQKKEKIYRLNIICLIH